MHFLVGRKSASIPGWRRGCREIFGNGEIEYILLSNWLFTTSFSLHRCMQLELGHCIIAYSKIKNDKVGGITTNQKTQHYDCWRFDRKFVQAFLLNTLLPFFPFPSLFTSLSPLSVWNKTSAFLKIVYCREFVWSRTRGTTRSIHDAGASDSYHSHLYADACMWLLCFFAHALRCHILLIYAFKIYNCVSTHAQLVFWWLLLVLPVCTVAANTSKIQKEWCVCI